MARHSYLMDYCCYHEVTRGQTLKKVSSFYLPLRDEDSTLCDGSHTIQSSLTSKHIIDQGPKSMHMYKGEEPAGADNDGNNGRLLFRDTESPDWVEVVDDWLVYLWHFPSDNMGVSTSGRQPVVPVVILLKTMIFS